jgi:hypothetical protein
MTTSAEVSAKLQRRRRRSQRRESAGGRGAEAKRYDSVCLDSSLSTSELLTIEEIAARSVAAAETLDRWSDQLSEGSERLEQSVTEFLGLFELARDPISVRPCFLPAANERVSKPTPLKAGPEVEAIIRGHAVSWPSALEIRAVA